MAARLRLCQGRSMAKTDEERSKRLAAALRENLKRRKAQAREAAETEIPSDHARREVDQDEYLISRNSISGKS